MIQELVEPDVWVEYQRVDMNNDNFARLSWADAIHRYNLMPDKCHVRTRLEGSETVWEYLM